MSAKPDPDVLERLSRAVDGDRLTAEDGLLLFERADLHDLGRAAHAITRRLHPDGVVTYIVDRNVNYTNICDTYCKFCAFYRVEGDEDAYLLSRDELSRKIEETKALGGRQILLQGGNHPGLPITWYEETIRFVQDHGIHLHGFSPSEIQKAAQVSDIPVAEAIARLAAAGLRTIPGGGAEILTERVRRRISPLKTKSHEWLDIMREAHGQGLRSTATMMFGHREDFSDRVAHLVRLRELQDETGGFTAFIGWTFQVENTKIDVPPVGSHDYLRTLAISRLMLDNFENIQSSWVTQGGQVGQLALFFGANDMGSTMIEENVVSAAGTVYALDEPGIRRLVEDAGFTPCARNVFYERETPEAEFPESDLHRIAADADRKRRETFGDRVTYARGEDANSAAVVTCRPGEELPSLPEAPAVELRWQDGASRATGLDVLRTIALTRKALPAETHLVVGWRTLGEKMAQVSLSFGVDDLGTIGTDREEERLRQWAEEAGRTPVRRDASFRVVEEVA